MDPVNIAAVKEFLLGLQENICNDLGKFDRQSSFHSDKWDRGEGGSGTTRVISNGAVFEKGGVNFSHIFGKTMPASATGARPELVGRAFQAMGVSVVIHPLNPFVPTSHANFRLFVAEKRVKNQSGGSGVAMTSRHITVSKKTVFIGIQLPGNLVPILVTSTILDSKSGVMNTSLLGTEMKPAA